MMTPVVRAIVLAAGASSRMGTPKPALLLTPTGETFLARLIRTATSAGLPDIVIVTGAADEAAHRAAGRVRPPVRFLHNPRWAEGQLTSLLAGLTARRGDHLEAALVLLVDTPFVSPQTLSAIVASWRRKRAPIVRPAQGQSHGHPVLFDRALFDELRAADPTIGAKHVIRAHAHEIVDVPVQDPGAFLDIDTPDAYRQAIQNL
jgi:CTP:molybdopterin cytidylyltransferase MocA